MDGFVSPSDFSLMAQTKEGALKIASMKIGITVQQYCKKVNSGLKWCYLCKKWLKQIEYTVDNSRFDKLSSLCKSCRSNESKKRYKPKSKTKYSGRSFVPARDGDKKQARRRVNYFVEIGLIPSPNDIKCVDCGHIGNDKRHEYDHHKGYSKEFHEVVEVVCTNCHKERSIRRGEWGRKLK